MRRGGTTLGWLRSKLGWLIGLATIATLVLWLVGIFALNRAAKYGKLSIPGSAVVQLPAGEVDLTLDAQVTNFGGNSSVSLPIPNLRVSVVPVGGGLIPGYANSVGSTTSVNSDAHREFAKLDVPAAGRYRVAVSGDVGGFIEPRLELGAPGLATKFLLGGGSIVLLLALVYTLSGLLQRQSTPTADTIAHTSAAGQARVSRRPLPWRTLGIELVGAAALLFLLFGNGGLHLPPQGRVDASGRMVTQSPSAARDSDNPLNSPLPTPTPADTVAANSTASLFRQANLAKALQALRARIGARGDIALMAIYPGELDLVQDDTTGNLNRVRVALDGTVTVGRGIPTQTGPRVIYVDQLNPSLIPAVEHQLTNEYNVPTREITELVLTNNLPNSTSGWDVKTVRGDGQPGPTFQTQLDGTGLHKLT